MASLSFATTVVIMIIIAGDSSAAVDLRPSDHGLIFQNSPPAPANSTEMRSFFNSSATSTSSDVSLPKATNSTESLPPSWGRASVGGGHWGGALMVATLVCGITGVILLLASALLYLKHRRRNPTSNDSFPHNDNNANKLYLVPAVSNL